MRESDNVLIDESGQPDSRTGDPRPLPSVVENRRRVAMIAADRPAGIGIATWAVLLISLVALAPTVGDFGLTWDEPAYRYSQLLGPVVGAGEPCALLA